MKVKEFKEEFDDKFNIEVYIPTDKINCTSIKEGYTYYKYSTNADDKEVAFYTTQEGTDNIMIFTK